jgi:hypothetical protein
MSGIEDLFTKTDYKKLLKEIDYSVGDDYAHISNYPDYKVLTSGIG